MYRYRQITSEMAVCVLNLILIGSGDDLYINSYEPTVFIKYLVRPGAFPF